MQLIGEGSSRRLIEYTFSYGHKTPVHMDKVQIFPIHNTSEQDSENCHAPFSLFIMID